MRSWLADIRKERQMSQQEVAKASGISQSYYASIETGVRGKPLRVPMAKAIAKALNFDWERFYEQEGA